MAELIYAIQKKNGKTISIDEVELKGLLCECICPRCKKDLLACALQSDKVQRYFRHHTDKKERKRGIATLICDPLAANESLLHQMAKEIIQEERSIYLPSQEITLDDVGVSDIPQNIKDKITRFEYRKARTIVGESVELEKRAGSFISDASIITDHDEILVEIFVRHKVEDEKKEKAKAYGKAMVEIDLSSFVEDPITREKLREIIITNADFKKWIYFPLSEDALKEAREYYENLEPIKQYRKAVAERSRRNKKIARLFNPYVYKNELNRLRSDEKFKNNFKQLFQPHFFDFCEYLSTNGSVPFFVDIPITGEMMFQCDRRIWQSLIFNRFVFGRKEDGATFNKESIYDALTEDHHISVDYDLLYKLDNPLRKNESIWLRAEVIETYLGYLETLGFITTRDSNRAWKTVNERHTIIPPNHKAAEALQDALRTVDAESPDVDRLIAEKMRDFYDEQRREAETAVKLREEERKKVREAELTVKAALAQERKRLREESIQNFNYDQCENTIEDGAGYRMAKCSRCNVVMRACFIAKYELPNLNKGICKKCKSKGL